MYNRIPPLKFQKIQINLQLQKTNQWLSAARQEWEGGITKGMWTLLRVINMFINTLNCDNGFTGVCKCQKIIMFYILNTCCLLHVEYTSVKNSAERQRNEFANECLLTLLGHAIRDLGKESGSYLLITMVFDSGTMCLLGLMVPTPTLPSQYLT